MSSIFKGLNEAVDVKAMQAEYQQRLQDIEANAQQYSEQYGIPLDTPNFAQHIMTAQNNEEQKLKQQERDSLAQQSVQKGIDNDKSNIENLKQELKDLEAKFDSNFEYSDDHSYWSQQKGIQSKIQGLKKRIKDAGGIDEAKEADYGPEWGEKVKRLGQMAKQGERKTVWDPVKRVYKTVPVNPQKKEQGVAEGSMSADEYKQRLLNTIPGMMDFFEKTVKGWKPSKEQMLAAVETGYIVMKRTGDVQQAGKAVMDELNTLHKMSQGQQGVAEGSAGVTVRQWANQVRKDHGLDVKFRNRQEGGGAVDSIIAKNSKGETVGVYNRKTGYPTVYEPKQGVKEDMKHIDSEEYNDEAGMADNNLETLRRAVDGIDQVINAGDNLPEWCQEKIAVAKGMLVAVWDYMKSEEERGAVEEDWQKVNKKDKTDGMSRKAVKAYRRENPGSKLKTAVTTKPSKLKKGSKAANRRKSFCARMSGMKKAHASAKTKRDPDSPINKALRRWNCESVEQMQELMMIAEQKIREAKNAKQQAAIAIAKKKENKLNETSSIMQGIQKNG